MSELWTDEDVRDMIRHKCADAGGLRAYARSLGVSPSMISMALSGYRPPNPTVLADLDLERVVRYVAR